MKLRRALLSGLSAVAFAGIVLAGCTTGGTAQKAAPVDPVINNPKIYTEEELGLRKTDLYTEDEVYAATGEYNQNAPGSGKYYERAFENAPPMVPHSVEGMLPITGDSNQCLSCHEKAVAPALQATAMPESHYYDMRNNKMMSTVNQARFNCSQCHAPQAKVPVAVANQFEPEFRQASDAKKSNLLDILNEGVE